MTNKLTVLLKLTVIFSLRINQSTNVDSQWKVLIVQQVIILSVSNAPEPKYFLKKVILADLFVISSDFIISSTSAIETEFFKLILVVWLFG